MATGTLDRATGSARVELTRKVTFRLALGLLGSADFPLKHTIPKTLPVPFTNFGHQPLVDHGLLQTILWTTVARMQAALQPWKKQRTPLALLNLGVAIVVLMVLAPIMGPTAAVPALISAIAGGVLIGRRTKRFRDVLADVKAKEIERLLAGDWTPPAQLSTSDSIRQRLDYVGSGELGPDRVPVLTVSSDTDAFPGYGRLQFDNTFVCRPKRLDHHVEEDAVKSAVVANAVAAVRQVDLAEISTGKVLTVHGDTLPIDSKWLGVDRSPLLWVSGERYAKFLEAADSASWREYEAIQAVFPNHIMAATFFLRTFMAGNAAACQLSLSTIGPPAADPAYGRLMLLRHRLRQEDKNKGFFEKGAQPSADDGKRTQLTNIFAIRQLTRDQMPFVNPLLNLFEVYDLALENDELEGSEHSLFQSEFKSVIAQSSGWPGSAGLRNGNLRDFGSYTFVTDFYGRPEMLACIRTMYDQVSRAILDSFDQFGFDIDQYKDAQGRYSINADKIDKLVIGERIFLDKKSDKKKPAAEPQPATSGD